MTRTVNDFVPEAFDLNCELDGVAYTLLGIANQIGSDQDSLTDETLVASLHSIQEHILRISEDWLLLSEIVTEKGKGKA